MRYTVSTPSAGHTGTVGGVTFVDGAAVIDETTHAAELAYCRSAGYTIEPLDAEPAADEEAGDDSGAEMPKKSASTEAWRAWAVQHGGMDAEEANTFSRDELVAHFTEENDS